MTSTASKQNVTAPKSTAPAATASYASAAGASGKAAATPVIATGTTVATGSSSTAPLSSSHAKSSSVSPLNGSAAHKTSASISDNANMASNNAPPKPVVPVLPAVVNGGGADHARKSSVTISATGPGGYGGGGPASAAAKAAAMPKFGYESPANVHSTPSQHIAAPIPIPGQPPIRSPAHSPSPIPQPSASGGRPPSISQDASAMKFGSLGGDGDRHMKHNPNLPQNNLAIGAQSPHLRQSSTHSVHSDMGNHNNHGAHNHNNHGNHGNHGHGHHGGPGSGRGGYSGQAGRGGRYNNGGHQYNNQSLGYPPPTGPQFPRGPSNQARNSMPQPFQPRPAMQGGYAANSPQTARVSPHIPPSVPNTGTPHMPSAIPSAAAPGFQPYQYPPPAGFPPANTYNYPQQFNVGYPTYPQMSYMNANQPAPNPSFPSPFMPGQFAMGPTAQPMSRNSSQLSERPNSSTGPVQTPVITPANISTGPTVVTTGVKTEFVKPPRKSAAIVIKNAQGETVDLNALKAPASPAPSAQAVSRTPPVVSTPTPPPKSVTPSHGRNESTSATKSVEQRRNEFMEQVRKQAEVASKPSEETSAASTTAAATETPVETKVAVEAAKPAEVKKAEAAQTAPAVAESKEAEKPKAADEKPVAKATAAETAPAAKKEEPTTTAVDDEEDEIERAIREMELAEAKREAEEAAYNEKKREETERKKKEEEANRLANAAENDRKLREMEREMERREEERERLRNENEANAAAGIKPKSAIEVLAEKIEKISGSASSADRKETAAPTAGSSATDALTSRLGDLKISGPKTSLPATETATKQQRANKPSALNLAPINTKSIEPPQPSAALQSLKTARFLRDPTSIAYPEGIESPNPAINRAVNKKGNFKYDMGFLLQFKDVFIEKPSLNFDQQVKQLLGEGDAARSGTRTPGGAGSGRSSSRNDPGFSSVGKMGSFGSKPLQPASFSDKRIAIPGGSMPRPSTQGVGQFGRPGGFPGPNPMSRTPSMGGGQVPHSPRQGSRTGPRGGSRRESNFGPPKNDAAAAKMPLTAGQVLKPIVVSASGWKPSSVGRGAQASSAPSGNGMMDPDMVQRKVKAALNKMTPEKFDKISDQILEIALQSKDEEDGRTLRQVIQLTFEKATDESHWAPMYARFCKRMLDMMSPEIRDTTLRDKKGDIISGGTLFRKYLLNRCQEEFERGWKVDLPQPKDGETKEMVMLSDEYYLAAGAKRRGLGLVQFIGELYKLGMLTERIMHECVRKLVDYETTPDEGEIESLSKLLRTVGANLDHTEKGRPMMDAYFVRIKNIIDIPDLPSRLKFMLMDIIDLRNRNWVSNENDKGPKTLEEVRQEAEAAAAAKAAEAARTSSQRGGPGGRSGPGGRGDSRQFSYNQPVQNQVGMDDLRRLKGSASRVASSAMTFGPTSMFASRSNSGRRNGPGGSFGRPGDDSNPASRTGTPPTRGDSNSVSHSNAFQALANVDTETPASPPSTAASPALSKANLEKTAGK